jgi:hypothetical protein
MLKLNIIVGMIVLAGVAFGVYHIEARVEGLRAQLKSVNAQIVKDKEAIHILEAEWSYLNQPQRLSELSTKLLKYKNMDSARILRVSDIPMNTTITATIASDPQIQETQTKLAQR